MCPFYAVFVHAVRTNTEVNRAAFANFRFTVFMRGASAGFRADWASGRDSVTVLGGIYRSDTDSRPVFGPVDLNGSNLTAKWTRKLSETTDFDVQVYVDNTRRPRISY